MPPRLKAVAYQPPPAARVPCQPTPGCNRFTPCGIRHAGAVTEIPAEVYASTRQLNPGASHAAGTWGASSFLFNPAPDAKEKFRRWARSKRPNGHRSLGLRIAGPLGDGFWVRAVWAMAHARWAAAMGLPVTIAYLSQLDTYYAPDRPGDGWTQYFQKVDNVPTEAHAFALDCFASARAWEDMGNYAIKSHSALAAQRQLRADLVDSLPLRPRRRFVRAADEFWRAHFKPGERVLGVHLRGTDKQRFRLSPHAYAPLVRAFLCAWPGAAIFLATDDNTQLEQAREHAHPRAQMRASLARPLVQFRSIVERTRGTHGKLVWRESLRGNSTLNVGVHAAQLSLASQAARLGEDVLVDTLLLSRTSFLLKGLSAVAEFATYFSEHLRQPNGSYDINFSGDSSQRRPAWANACRRRDVQQK